MSARAGDRDRQRPTVRRLRPRADDALELPAAEFAATWISERYGIPVALAGTVAALAGLGGAPR